jgi:hypothetical protein
MTKAALAVIIATLAGGAAASIYGATRGLFRRVFPCFFKIKYEQVCVNRTSRRLMPYALIWFCVSADWFASLNFKISLIESRKIPRLCSV